MSSGRKNSIKTTIKKVMSSEINVLRKYKNVIWKREGKGGQDVKEKKRHNNKKRTDV